MKSLKVVVAAAVLMAATQAASAPSPAASQAASARKGNFKEIGGAFKTINDELKSGAPDFNSIRPAAKDLAARSAALAKQFPKGSGPQEGLKTRAKASIWTDYAGFTKLQNEMVVAANALNAAAIKGDVAGVTAARTALGATCKSCHDKFREND